MPNQIFVFRVLETKLFKILCRPLHSLCKVLFYFEFFSNSLKLASIWCLQRDRKFFLVEYCLFPQQIIHFMSLLSFSCLLSRSLSDRKEYITCLSYNNLYFSKDLIYENNPKERTWPNRFASRNTKIGWMRVCFNNTFNKTRGHILLLEL